MTRNFASQSPARLYEKQEYIADTQEVRMAHLLEIWLKLVVMQKRVDILKNIKAWL